MGTPIETVLRTMTEKIARLEEQIKRRNGQDGGGYWVPLPPWAAFGPFAATTITHLIAIPRDGTLRQLSVATYTVAPNDAGNHWTLSLSDGAGVSLIAAQSVETDTASTWTSHIYTTFADAGMVTSRAYIYLVATKVGAPGALQVANPLLFFI